MLQSNAADWERWQSEGCQNHCTKAQVSATSCLTYLEQSFDLMTSLPHTDKGTNSIPQG